MEKNRINQIEEEIKRAAGYAEGIMNGDDGYDGADGAREVLVICGLADELIAALRHTG